MCQTWGEYIGKNINEVFTEKISLFNSHTSNSAPGSIVDHFQIPKKLFTLYPLQNISLRPDILK